MVKIEVQAAQKVLVTDVTKWTLDSDDEELIKQFHLRRRGYQYYYDVEDIDRDGYIIPCCCPPEPTEKEWVRLS